MSYGYEINHAPFEMPEYLIGKPLITRYDYLMHISHKFKCSIDSLQTVLGPHLPVQIFYLACLSNDWYEMYHMISEFGVDINMHLAEGLPALWFAAKNGNFHIVQNLLLLGANPNPVNTKGLTAVDIANINRFNRTAYLLRAYGGLATQPHPHAKK